MRTTLTYSSVQFGTSGQVVNDDIADHVHPANVVPDSQRANIHIATSDGNLRTFNSHSGVTEVAPKTTTVQFRQPTNRVAALGTTVEPEVLENLRKMAPEAFEEPTAKQAHAKEAVADAAKEAADLADLNKFADPAVEGVHMHISNDVGFGDQVRLLHELHTTGTVSTSTINRFADQMHMSVADTIDAVNALHTNTSLQLSAMCGAHGVDAQAFSNWMKRDHSNEMFKAIQVHSQDRDMVRAWGGHISAFKARGQK
jgi:hypothetical protein